MPVVRLEALVRANGVGLTGVQGSLRRNRTTFRRMLTMFKTHFTVRNGVVRSAVAAAAPAAETPEERRARMDRQYQESQRLREEQDRRKEERQREKRDRLRDMRGGLRRPTSIKCCYSKNHDNVD